MFRLLCALAVIAFIFVHSPERPKESLPIDASRWVEHVQGSAVQAALRSDLARDLLRGHLAPNEKPAEKGTR